MGIHQQMRVDRFYTQSHDHPKPKMTDLQQPDYPKTVYDNAWEDLGVMYESWKSVHGVDQKFCIDIIRKFANHLTHEQ